ncbi:hypothetical protein C464_11560 [Halorubrum coriense DSM 10284]|uniref:Small CPxCG-related zinc finger protein n=1 Tax=Halorubrum coriense DSM 10284 TaxID=1227466 RepID=M0EFY8_9EURY|nr:hypothetical protein [Halorubrum coriense]ELZ45973.1 hypothetical protein C464_11560 [Halorubrum coriense DSM 10284]
MIPPIVRWCPECGASDWSRRFAVVVDASGRRLVECPECGHRFEPLDNPLLN